MSRKPDMLIIMGTSLKVHGFKKLVKEFARTVHESAAPACSPSKSPNPKAPTKSHAGKVVFVNKTAPGAEWEGIIDYHVVGETDKWAERVLEEWKKARPADWEVQTKLTAAGDVQTAGAFKVSKEITNTFDAVKGKGRLDRCCGSRPFLTLIFRWDKTSIREAEHPASGRSLLVASLTTFTTALTR